MGFEDEVEQSLRRPYRETNDRSTLMQLRFASLVVTNSRWDLHPQECAHAGRTTKRPPEGGLSIILSQTWLSLRGDHPPQQTVGAAKCGRRIKITANASSAF
jgi:hypothetical protein